MTAISDSHSPPGEEDIRAGVRLATVVLAVFGLLHAWASWGYAGPMFGAHGSWLHALERYAGGQTPYRDFAWSNPPLALWILGSIARVTGSSLAAISVSTLVVYIGILALFERMVQRLTREVALSVTVTTLLFATAYAGSTGVPLPLGTVAIGDAVGMLFLLGAVNAAIALSRSPERRYAIATGVLSGLAFASTTELWPVATYVVVIGALVLKHDRSPRAAVALVTAFVAVLTVVFGWVLVRYGAGPVSMLRHTALVPGAIETTLPTAERVVIESATVSAFTLFATISLWLCLAISDRVAARWAGAALIVFLSSAAVHLGMSVSKAVFLTNNGPSPYPGVIEASLIWMLNAGYSVRTAALRILDDRFREHLFPILFPIFLLVVVLVRWTRWTNHALRNQVAAMLGLCFTARFSSGFRGTDWYNVLFEIVTYVQMMRLGGEMALRQAGRAVLALLATLMLIGGYTYFSQARGPATMRGAWPAIETPRGRVRWDPVAAAHYARVQQILAEHPAAASRSLLAFGATAGWNYWLGRPNYSPIMLGMHQLAPRLVDSVVTSLIEARPGPILIDHAFLPRSEIVQITPWYWQAVRGPSRYATIDRPLFDRIREGCQPFGPADSTVVMLFYDCRPPGQATR